MDRCLLSIVVTDSAMPPTPSIATTAASAAPNDDDQQGTSRHERVGGCRCRGDSQTSQDDREVPSPYQDGSDG